jgi:MFS family permease
MALGLLQALSAVGNMFACLITLSLPNIEHNWRWAYFVGAAPALLVLWIRSSVKEPEQWHQAKAAAALGRELGNITELFTHPILRRNTLAATLLGTAGVGALWGIAYFSTDMIREELLQTGMDRARIGRLLSFMFLVQQAGAFVGAYLFAAFADRLNRRGAFFLWFALAWASILGFFWGIQGSGLSAFGRSMLLAPIMGFCTLGPFSGYTIYFPELFPTRLRTTGCGFCYNAARVLAAGAPFALGGLRISLGGYAQAATVVSSVLLLGFVGAYLGPETKGEPLPDDAELADATAGGFPVR